MPLTVTLDDPYDLALCHGRTSGKESHRIERASALPHLEVNVRRTGVAGRAHLANHLSALDALAPADAVPPVVGVARLETVPVIDDHHPSVAAHSTAERDAPGGCRLNGRARRNANVDPQVVTGPSTTPKVG